MQEVFKKIIDKLKEYKYENFVERNSEQIQHCKDVGDCEGIDCLLCVFDKAIKIVKREAEKFGTDTNVGSNGWIPVSERMPNQDGEFSDVLITCESIADGVFVQSAEFYIAADGEPVFDALYHYERVLAWQPLPHPYTKGERT